MSLETLRNELAEVDRELMALIAKRQHLSKEIGRIKRESGIPTRDYRQEKVVLQRARDAAEEHGVSPDMGEALILLLIRSSLTAQEQDLVAAQGTGTGKRVLIIGGSGNMGRWFVRFLVSQDYRVDVADPAGEVAGCRHFADWRDAGLDYDIIIVAAPMAVSNKILHELAERKAPGLIFDIGSLKSPMRTGLMALAQSGAKVTSIHPMFGPSTELLSGRHIIFIDLGNKAATEEAKALFASTMATQVELDLESHDRLIAYVLGLSHAVNIAFFTALAESGEAAPKLAQMSSTTFDAQLAVASNVAAENPELYFHIQTLNDYGTESLSALLYAVERLRSVVRANDQPGFTALMERGRRYVQQRLSELKETPS